jgi:RimJ/RimL family protein N-acetyltransferase
MANSSDPRLAKKVGKFYCGRFMVRALRIQDATDRMTAWLSDPEALEVLNVPARRLTNTDIANYIRSFDQRTHLLGGIFDRSNNLLVGILQLDIDYRVNRALVNLLIGEPAYRNLGVTTEIFIPALDYGFINYGIDIMAASVLVRHSMLVGYLMKTGWKMDPKAKGQIRSAVDGTMLDVQTFTLTRGDWNAWKQTDRAKRIIEILKSHRS